MADYYSILKKTVSGLPNNTASTRLLVYDKARTTIDRQLRSLNPPPTDAAIESQMQALEQAVERIEAEFATEPAPPAPPPTEQPLRAPSASAEDPDFAPRTVPAPAFEEAAPIDEVAEFGGQADERISSLEDGEERSGGLTRVIIALVVLGMLGGGGYALWLNKDPLLAAMGLNGTATTVAEAVSDSPVDDGLGATDNSDKEEVRLGSDGQTVDPVEEAEPQEVEAVEEERSVRVVDPEDGADSVEVSPVDDAIAPEAESTEPEVAATDPDEEIEVPAIGQKAFLYEEGLGTNAATRDNAAVIWSTEQQPPGEGLPPEPVIKGLLEVPGRGLTLDLTVRRNVDESLSASHIIELVFNVPPDFSGGSIDTLARFVMKANEQARGEPLVAVPVKINTGFFMIALNNLEQARESNKRLLIDSSWIDIPLGYTSGRRALVTLEKGAIGDQVFREAFEDWDNR